MWEATVTMELMSAYLAELLKKYKLVRVRVSNAIVIPPGF